MSFKAICIGDVFELLAERARGDIALTYAANAFEALGLLRLEPFDAVAAKLPIVGCSAAETFLDEVQRLSRGVRVIFCDPDNNVERAMALGRRGAFDIAGEDRLPAALMRCAESKPVGATLSPSAEPWRKLLIGASPRMQQVAELIRLVANRRSTVLISGETGTGKEVVARAIHEAGNRAQFPFIAVNCGALPETLLEAELFGHVKGAFTGAVANRLGRFEQAHRGTLFLDEIGDMPVSLQAKLLRVLQDREFQRLGSSENVRVDVRIVAATNVHLVERMREGKFREDLYYRLNVVPIPLPPLRERRGDIPLLALHFINRICGAEGIPPKETTRELLDRLSRLEWPGNVRQLENAIEMAIALSGDRGSLSPADFPLPSRLAGPAFSAGVNPFIAVPDGGLDFEQMVGSIERNLLEQALNKTKGNKKAAAEMLGLKRTTLSAKLKTLSLAAAAAL